MLLWGAVGDAAAIGAVRCGQTGEALIGDWLSACVGSAAAWWVSAVMLLFVSLATWWCCLVRLPKGYAHENMCQHCVDAAVL